MDDGNEEYEDIPSEEQPDLKEKGKKERRLVPDDTAELLYARWKGLLGSLVAPYLQYQQSTFGKEWIRGSPELSALSACECESLPCVLVANGLFPTSPLSPRMAVSVELLDLFLAVSERSSDAVTALAVALNRSYRSRGFVARNSKGDIFRQPFRRGLGYALRWYDCLRVEIERRKEAAIAAKFNRTQQQIVTAGSIVAATNPAPALEPELVEAARELYARCPACFGLKVWGRSIAEGGDVHVAVDGNFNHRHLRSAGNSPKFYDPTYVLSKEKLDAAGARIEQARKREKPKEAVVPDTAVDSCEESHESGTGSTVKTSMEKFDSGGLAALVCRHDIPLYIANIDTPGEQQKYAVAMLDRVLELLPPQATVVVLYDVGCVLDRSIANYEIYPDTVSTRLLFATSVMHAYVHVWSCQLHYNPRMKRGLGLTDGENVERLWSALRRLIGVCRNSAAHRRIWLIDRQVGAIAQERRGELGVWLRRKLTKGVADQRAEALAALKDCGVDEAVLREQWALQKKEELSLRAREPAKLKKDLSHLMNLQDTLDTAERSVANCASLLKSGALSKAYTPHLGSLREQLAIAQGDAQKMYIALNVNDEFPSLAGAELEFVRKIFLLRELKQAVQKRATSAFWEFDKLDRAAGGKDMALGTKMHQHVRHAMSKKTSALESAVKRYNTECKHLASLKQPSCRIPIPEPLPTSLADLKTSTTLMENVWVDPIDQETHRWVRDVNVRDGIRAMHKIDRCSEELHRLGREADNMLRWYKRELAAVVEAIQDPESTYPNLCMRDGGDEATLVQEKKRGTVDTAGADRRDLSQFDEEELDGEETDLMESTPEEICLNDLAEEHAAEDAVLQPESRAASPATPNRRPRTGIEVLPPPNVVPQIPIPNDSWTLSTVVRANLAIDTGLPHAYALPDLPASRKRSTLPRDVPHPISGQVHATLEHSDLERLASATAWLNDECVNALAAHLLQLHLQSVTAQIHSTRFMLFSSFAFESSPAVLRRNTKHLQYWTRDIWIVPINRRIEQHWVVAVILPAKRQLYLFDSFADFRSWEADIPRLIQLVRHLADHAKLEGHPVPLDWHVDGPWSAESVVPNCLQFNSHDCGVWVLAAIASFLRGYHTPRMSEEDITVFRSYLYRHALHLAVRT
ncbi:hypothetical protein DFP72DRAFT_821404 [Ephemerocybe angulata]|uniref:Ubiquitin-like protease family profile domain-containing protein n=1 Tax=Ephemerocybe angulata TaxID=980116 RepID=A0A8H6HIP7_9AGAR|nr:hypothetical protein DFP72DRAFT_821404 [Tulosesus angulatus]